EIGLLNVESGASSIVLSGPDGVTLGNADWSPAQEWLLFTSSKHGGLKQVCATRFPRSGGSAGGAWNCMTSETEQADLPRWSVDGRSVYYVSKRDGRSCIWGRRFDAARGQPVGAPFPVAHYHDARMTPDRTGPTVRGL